MSSLQFHHPSTVAQPGAGQLPGATKLAEAARILPVGASGNVFDGSPLWELKAAEVGVGSLFLLLTHLGCGVVALLQVVEQAVSLGTSDSRTVYPGLHFHQHHWCCIVEGWNRCLGVADAHVVHILEEVEVSTVQEEGDEEEIARCFQRLPCSAFDCVLVAAAQEVAELPDQCLNLVGSLCLPHHQLVPEEHSQGQSQAMKSRGSLVYTEVGSD